MCTGATATFSVSANECSNPNVEPTLIEKLESIVSATTGLDETCKALIAAANDAGGPDNITVAMLKVDVA